MSMTRFDFIETDKRIIEQKVRKHQLSSQEYQKKLKSLPDEKDQADELVVCKNDGEAHSG